MAILLFVVENYVEVRDYAVYEAGVPQRRVVLLAAGWSVLSH